MEKQETQTPTEEKKQEEEKKLQVVTLGIDFGTKKSVVAISKDLEETPKIASNDLSNDQTPMLISFLGHKRYIGEEALSHLVSSPTSTIHQLKRLVGRSFEDLKPELSRFSVPIYPSASGNPILEVSYKNDNVKLTPEQLVGMVLNKVKWFVHKKEGSGESLDPNSLDCVISVPGVYGAEERKAIISSALIAQIRLKSLINESTAAALTYGYNNNPKENEKKTVLFVEMGHSYSSAQVVQFTKNKLQVLGSSFERNLGAYNLDEAIFTYCAEEFKKQYNLDVKSHARATSKLWRASEKTKEILSTIQETEMRVDCLMSDTDLVKKISRGLLEKLASSHLEKIPLLIRGALAAASLTIEQIDAVEAIGGGLRIPLVQERVKAAIAPKELGFRLDSAHCIAIGAALYARILDKQFDYVVEDPSISQTLQEPSLSAEQIAEMTKSNDLMTENDKMNAKKGKKRNEIESFIYEKRNQVENKELVSEEEKKKALVKLTEDEHWLRDLEEETVTLEDLSKKLEEMKEEVNKLTPRLAEHLSKEEEERKKAAEEAKNFVYVPQSKEDREPRTKKERMEAAKKRKEQGNALFKDGNFEDAILRYSQSVAHCEQMFDMTDEQKKEVEELKVSCYLNLSASFMRLKKYERAKENATMVLKLEENNVKALFRRGQALYYLREFDGAKDDLQKASKLEPTNADIRKQLKQVQDKLQEEKEKQKKVFSKMFA